MRKMYLDMGPEGLVKLPVDIVEGKPIAECVRESWPLAERYRDETGWHYIDPEEEAAAQI